MATGGDLSRTLEDGQEIFYDFPCSLCENEGKCVEAASYCEECFVYMCNACVKSHNRIPLNTRHKLLNQGQFMTVRQSALKSFPTKHCSKHPGEMINMFCGNHDVVCCSVCKALEHRNCSKTHHLPEAAKGIQASNEFQNIKKETQEFLSDLQKVLADRKTDIFRISKERQQVKQSILDFRKKANKYFDDLEQKSLNELNLKETSIVSRLEKDRDFLDATKREAEDILQQLNSYKGDNECELFYNVKTGKVFVHESMKRVLGISSTAPESIAFTVDADIEKYLSSLVTIGSFVDSHGTTTKPVRRAPPPPLPPRSDQSANFIKYDTKLFGKFDINEMSDRNVCSILDICKLPNGNILIVDCNNNKLKRLDQSYKLLDSIILQSPTHVCAIGPYEAAVSQCGDKKIQFVSVGKKLTTKGAISTGSYCRGMVYVDGQMFVCCGDPCDSSSCCIEVYNHARKLQHIIPRAAVPTGIMVSDDRQRFLVTTFGSDDISVLDFTGNVINTFSSRDLRDPAGMCTDGKGQVFVCGVGSNTVVQISLKHHNNDVVLKEADGIIEPRKAYYDCRLSCLLVACGSSNELLAYTCTLHQTRVKLI